MNVTNTTLIQTPTIPADGSLNFCHNLSLCLSAYPTVHSSPLVQHEVIANYSLLYYLQGSDPKLTPYMLMGHLDVVPIPDPSVWEAPPFSGEIRDGFIYGRGTIDNKQTLFVSSV